MQIDERSQQCIVLYNNVTLNLDMMFSVINGANANFGMGMNKKEFIQIL